MAAVRQRAVRRRSKQVYQIYYHAEGFRPEDRSDYVGRSVLRSASFSMVNGTRSNGLPTLRRRLLPADCLTANIGPSNFRPGILKPHITNAEKVSLPARSEYPRPTEKWALGNEYVQDTADWRSTNPARQYESFVGTSPHTCDADSAAT